MRFRPHCILTGVLLILLMTGCGGGERRDDVPVVSDDRYRRIISMAPNITETLYALGLGDRIVGVTSFCEYPPEALEKPRVGGLLDPNYEVIAALKPDLVLLLPEHEMVRGYLDELEITHSTVQNRTVQEILASIDTIGVLCGVEAAADSVREDIERRIGEVVDRAADRPVPSVLICISRTLGAGRLEDVYVAAPGTFYDELIGYAGGVNAYAGGGGSYPLLSLEGLLHLDPAVIIDLASGLDPAMLDPDLVSADWYAAGTVAAVRDHRVHLITADYATIPGPRFVQLLEDLAVIIHPEAP